MQSAAFKLGYSFMILSDAFCWFAEEWSEAWSDSMSLPSPEMIWRDKCRRIGGGDCMTGVKSSCQGNWRQCERKRANTFLYAHSVHIPLHSWIRTVCTTKRFFLCCQQIQRHCCPIENRPTVLCDNKGRGRLKINFMVNKTQRLGR